MFARLEEFRFARWVKSLNRWTQILFSLTLVAALNYLAARHFLRWDLTADHRYTLSPETLSYLDQKVPRTPEPLYIYHILPDNPTAIDRVVVEQTKRLLNEYAYDAKHVLPNGSIPLVYHDLDPLRERQKYDELTRLGMTSTTRVMVFRGNRFRNLDVSDLVSSKDNSFTGYKGENAITSAILDVVQTEPDEIYFTTGHKEFSLASAHPDTGLSRFVEFLSSRHFTLKELNLSGDEIPPKARLVVIAAAANKFLDSEIAKLRRYLNQNNGRVLIFLQPGEDAGLDGLLHEWGLRSPDRFVLEDKHYQTLSGDMIIDPSTAAKEPHELVRFLALSRGAMTLIFGPTRPVQTDLTAADDGRRQVSELLFSSKASRLYKISSTDPEHPEDTGAFSLAALSERRTSDAVKLDGGRVLAIGTVSVILNHYFDSHANPDFILKCFDYLAGRENFLNIPPHLPQQTTLDIGRPQYVGLAWRFAVVPAVIALFGLIVFWVRNRL